MQTMFLVGKDYNYNDEQTPTNNFSCSFISYIISFNHKVNDWFGFLQAGNRWNRATIKHHQNQPNILPNFSFYLSTSITAHNSVCKNTSLVVVYYLSMENDPSFSFKINFGTPLSLYFIHPWILFLVISPLFPLLLLHSLLGLFP